MKLKNTSRFRLSVAGETPMVRCAVCYHKRDKQVIIRQD
jgi:hypothetical protein